MSLCVCQTLLLIKNLINLRAQNRHADFADNILEICVIKSNDF